MSSEIAIVGMACRLPGGVENLNDYWQLLEQKRDAIQETPKDRWDARQYYDPHKGRPGKSYVNHGGFLTKSVTAFDPQFFGISPREAECLDPQQRLLLELCWEAMENAGAPLSTLQSLKTGVFVGGFCLDSQLIHQDRLNQILIDAKSATASSMAILANRISHVFNLTGPSMAIDTACSASLVATHMACQTLLSGDADVCLVGGVNIMFGPGYPITMSQGRFLSPHGRCKAFDEDASGYTRAEGGGVVLLKPLHKALENNDNIYSVILASGANQDGATVGIALPNKDAQVKLMQSVYSKAKVKPAEIQYIECHGTGTQAGDTAEIGALSEVFTAGREIDLMVGSVKTNIGHLEAAAGVASLIKTSLCLYKKQLLPNLHFNRPNPAIPFETNKIKVLTENMPWPAHQGKAMAGINSFGYGGTNAHLLLAEAPQKPHLASVNTKEVRRLFPISAKNKEALTDRVKQISELLARDKNNFGIDALYHTLTSRRSHLESRVGIWAESQKDFQCALEDFLDKRTNAAVTQREISRTEQSKVAFVFTGMGPQWFGMGRTLYQTNAVYKKVVEECDAFFQKISGWSILAEMLKPESSSRLAETAVAQPANFVLQAALTAVLQAQGITPDAVVGHSVGEVSAAYVSGMLSLEDALKVSYHRSRLQAKTAGQGTMLAAEMDEQKAKMLLNEYSDVSLAAVNASQSVTFAGTKRSLEKIAEQCRSEGAFCKMLDVEVAYHSYQMDQIKDELLDALQLLSPQKPCLPLYSTVLGRISDSSWKAQYWWDNVRKSVLFGTTLQEMLSSGYTHFIEVGPHPVLRNALENGFKQANADAHKFQTLNRSADDVQQLEQLLASLFTHGFAPQWAEVESKTLVHLPNYPWQKEEFWRESELSKQSRLGSNEPVFRYLNQFGAHPAWKVECNQQFFPFLEDHVVENAVVFPGAAYLEAALQVAKATGTGNVVCIEGMTFENMLVYQPLKVHDLLSEYHPESRRFTISSMERGMGKAWTRHATAKLSSFDKLKPEPLDLGALRLACTEEVSIKDFYKKLTQSNLNYGPYFQGIVNLKKNQTTVVSHIKAPPELYWPEDFLMHPPLMDCCFQSLLALVGDSGSKGAYVPVALKKSLFYSMPPKEFISIVQLREQSASDLVADITLASEAGQVYAKLEGVKCQALAGKQATETASDMFYAFEWNQQEQTRSQQLPQLAECLVVWDEEWDVSQSLGMQLSQHKNPAGPFQKIAQMDLSKQISNTLLFFCKKKSLEGVNEYLTQRYAFLRKLLLASPQRIEKLVFVTQGAVSTGHNDALLDATSQALSSLAQVASNEFAGVSYLCIDVDQQSFDSQCYLAELQQKNQQCEVAYRAQNRFVKRLAKLPAQQLQQTPTRVLEGAAAHLETYTLAIDRLGSIENLYYKTVPGRSPQAKEVRIKVDAAGLNFKDLLKIYGQLPSEVMSGTFFGETLGMELTGEITEVGSGVQDYRVGDKIVTPARLAFSNDVTITADYLIPRPAGFTPRESLFVVVYLTALYGLVHRAQLQKGEKVLIHNGTGGVGLAAIQVARWLGAEVYTTAGTPEKRKYLKEMGIRHVYDSRNLDFAEEIRRDTEGYGIDVVLNAISGPALEKTLALLAPYGRFIEIGKKDIAGDFGLPLASFNRGLSFTAIDIDRMLCDRKSLIQALLRELSARFAAGDFIPVPNEMFAAADIGDAFRFMALSKHVGKVGVSFENARVEVRESPFSFERTTGTILVTGGSNGFGFEVSKWLAAQSRASIVMLSRSGLPSAQAEQEVAQFCAQGHQLFSEKLDISNTNEVGQALQRLSEKYGNITGIVHSATVLDDGFIKDLSTDRFSKVLDAKVEGLLNLISCMRACGKMPQFVLSFSSISSLIGNPGQANYVVANRFLDAYSSSLRNEGVRAVTINWGVLGEAGMAYRNKEVGRLLNTVGIHGISTADALNSLDAVLKTDLPQIGVFDVTWTKWAEAFPKAAKQALFQDLAEASPLAMHPAKKLILDSLLALGQNERQAHMVKIISEQLCKVLKTSMEKIDPKASINTLGVDSLMSLEVLVAIEMATGVTLTTLDLLKGPSPTELADLLLGKLLTQEDVLLGNLDEMSEEELDKLLLEEANS